MAILDEFKCEACGRDFTKEDIKLDLNQEDNDADLIIKLVCPCGKFEAEHWCEPYDFDFNSEDDPELK